MHEGNHVTAYYNECDPYAAQWLRNLIAAEHIAPGVVDERSIEDVRPSELAGFTQCHFFAGIGVWSYALRLAGWPDDRPVWTGSCPCQPFSAAGKGKGFADERHLWPAWFHIIEQSRPDTIFGEQVEAAIKHDWLDLVRSDLEGIGYAFAPVGVPAAGVGAPHIRQRLWFVAHADRARRGQAGLHAGASDKETCGPSRDRFGYASEDDRPQSVGTGRMADTQGERRRETGTGIGRQTQRASNVGESSGVANTKLQQRQRSASGCDVSGGRHEEPATSTGLFSDNRPGPTNNHWRDADWLYCRDGKWRPVEPGTFPLATGVANRVGRLRAYGNAICAEVAKEVIQAYMAIGEEQCSLF